MFSSLSKNHTPYEQIHISSGIVSVQLKYGTETPSYRGPKWWNLVLSEYKTIVSLADFKANVKTCVPEELFLQVMQNIYSANRFCLISPHDNSRILRKLST